MKLPFLSGSLISVRVVQLVARRGLPSSPPIPKMITHSIMFRPDRQMQDIADRNTSKWTRRPVPRKARGSVTYRGQYDLRVPRRPIMQKSIAEQGHGVLLPRSRRGGHVMQMSCRDEPTGRRPCRESDHFAKCAGRIGGILRAKRDVRCLRVPLRRKEGANGQTHLCRQFGL